MDEEAAKDTAEYYGITSNGDDYLVDAALPFQADLEADQMADPGERL